MSLAIAIGGGAPSGARLAAETLVRKGASALMSFGLAGGLDASLAPGSIVIPRRVASWAGVWMADPALADRCGGVTVETLFAGQKIAATAQDKTALHQLTGASAIDLESGEVASVAASHGLPFVVLRVICDPAGLDLPPAALAALDGAGVIGAGRIIASLLAHPGQLAALLSLASAAAAARRTLAAAARAFAAQ